MRKSLGLICALALGLAACGPIPQTPSDMRALSNPLIEKSSVSVPRSPNSVAKSLERGAWRCLNKYDTQHISFNTGYGVSSRAITHMYETDMRKGASGRAELMVYKTTQGAITPGAPGGKHLAYLVDIIPSSGGTKLEIYGGKMGYGDLNNAIVKWAKGGALSCPNMP